MIKFGNGVIEFENINNATSIQIHYNGRVNFYQKNPSYFIKKNRKLLIISLKKKPTSVHIIKYAGEFKPINVRNILDGNIIPIKSFGLSYWDQDEGNWEDDTLEWQNDNISYISKNKIRNIFTSMIRGY